ncbi:MAG TPA: carbohydrate ABC transporter permease [Caldilineaceae bacterium]|nr:carbohydrate ABC transporter permease [Caldilineaceae bacterium]
MEETMGVGGRWRAALPLTLLILLTVPIVIGYIWVLISTFAERTHGLTPVDANGNFGGLTLENWAFLWEEPIVWQLAFNTFVLATGLTIGVVIVSSMAGYALSRISFPGRKTFLATTLILHAFPSVTLLIAIYFVLRWITGIPILGRGIPLIGGFGYNTLGGVILVSVALELPLGIWLMKGFFDQVSWDMERAALIDGCSRFRAWRQIVMPMIRPGIAALSIFSFISGWNAFLIPYTFMTTREQSTIAPYLRGLVSDTAPVNYSEVAAVGLFQLIPILIFFIFTQETLLSIFGGGSKGGT